MPKYDLDQEIWFLINGNIYSGTVLSRMIIDNKFHNLATEEQRNTFNPFGEDAVYYSTIHGVIEEKNAFESKKALLNS